jgi:amidophosphoribosyltransferase
MGLVHEVFDDDKLVTLYGKSGIGHIRYSTTGRSRLENAQPIAVSSSAGDISVAHNGDIINASILRDKLQKQGWAFITDTDSEILVRLFANELTITQNNPVAAMRNVMKEIVGSYALVVLIKDKLLAVRDPFGIKPLCLGRYNDKGYVVASESVALDAIDAAFMRDIYPGEIIEIDNNSYKIHRVAAEAHPAHCMFEYVYFARPDAVMDGRCVYDVRMRIGERVAMEHPVNADIVCPVPDSGTAYAIGFSAHSKIPFAEGLMKNRYAWRTFIMPYQTHREIGVKEKLNPIKSLVADKRVVLIDDSSPGHYDEQDCRDA